MTLNQGVPQGLVLRPILFTLYTSPLGDICHCHGVNFHGYADDSQIFLTFKPSNADQSNKDHCLDTVQSCLADIRVWMHISLLKLHDYKTELMILGTKQLIKVGDTEIITVNDSTHNTSSVRNLDFYYDSQQKNITHINTLRSTLFATIHKISKIGHMLDINMTKILIQALVLSKVDYCNSLLLGTANYHLAMLQRIQNTAYRLIYRKSKSHHVTPLLMQLHWLKVHDHIIYKVAVLMYRCVIGLAPEYLRDLVVKDHGHSLRSTTTMKLPVSHSRTSITHNSSFTSM